LFVKKKNHQIVNYIVVTWVKWIDVV